MISDNLCTSQEMIDNGHRDFAKSLQWRHNDHDGVSNHQPHGCLLNRLFRRRSKKTPKLRVTGLCVGNSPGPVNSQHKWPITRKMFAFEDVIMSYILSLTQLQVPAVHFAFSNSNEVSSIKGFIKKIALQSSIYITTVFV